MAASNSVLEAHGKHVTILNNKLVARINLLDNSQTVLLVDPTATVEAVLRLAVAKVELPSPDDMALNFSLHECLDGVTISRQLDPKAVLLTLMEEWPEEGDPKLVIQVKLYCQAMLESKHPKVIRMMYIQAVYNVIAGLYQVDIDMVVRLAALQIFAKFGKHDSEKHKPGFLTSTLLEYIPSTIIRKRTPEEWETLLFAQHESVEVEDPEREYLNICMELEYYGCQLFGVKQLFDKRLQRHLILGVNRRGILILKPADNVSTSLMTLIAEHSLNDIYRWAYKPGVNFYFEVKPEDDDDENPVYTFSTSEGKAIADLLTDYAMGMLREMGLNEDGTRRGDEDEAKGDAADADEAGDDAKEDDAAGDDDAGAAASDLPEGWIEVPDEASGAVYFYNNLTGESMWEKPTE